MDASFLSRINASFQVLLYLQRWIDYCRIILIKFYIAEPFSKIVGLDGEVSAGADKDVGDDNDGNEAAILEKTEFPFHFRYPALAITRNCS